MNGDRKKTAEVWLFDVDGTLVDSFDAQHLRPYVRELFTELTARGISVAVWSAGGIAHATQIVDRHQLGDFVSSIDDKVVGADGYWELPASLDSSNVNVVCVDDQPVQLPKSVQVRKVFPYLRPNPHDRALAFEGIISVHQM